MTKSCFAPVSLALVLTIACNRSDLARDRAALAKESSEIGPEGSCTPRPCDDPAQPCALDDPSWTSIDDRDDIAPFAFMLDADCAWQEELVETTPPPLGIPTITVDRTTAAVGERVGVTTTAATNARFCDLRVDGMVLVDGGGAGEVASDGSIVTSYGFGAAGPHELAVSCTDGFGASSSASVIVEVGSTEPPPMDAGIDPPDGGAEPDGGGEPDAP